MHTYRFFSEDYDDQQLSLSADEYRHLRVIRAKIGQVIEVGDGQGNIFICQLQSFERNYATCQIVSRRFVARPTTSLTTVIGVQMLDTFERILRSITELIIDSIVVFRHNNYARFKLRSSSRQRWRKIILGATKQSKRAWLPSLTITSNWQDLLQIINDGNFSCKLLLDSNGRDSLNYFLDRNRPRTVCLINGSSCGFRADELANLKAIGAIPLNLGGNILRAETAIVLATGFVNVLSESEQSPRDTDS